MSLAAGAGAGFKLVFDFELSPRAKSKSSLILESAATPKVSSLKASSSSRSLKSKVSRFLFERGWLPGGAEGSNPKNDMAS